MSTVATTFRPNVSAALLSGGAFSIPSFAGSSSDGSDLLYVGFPDFDLRLGASLIDLENKDDYSEVSMKAFLDQGVSAKLTLKNDLIKNFTEPLIIRDVSLKFEVTEHRSRSHFLADSLYAAIGLSGNINISMRELELDLNVRFKMPLSEISNFLQRRQIYFGLLIIEQATGLQFQVPEFIPGEDIDAISFVYHAVTKRDFRWACNEVTLMLPATVESLDWLNSLIPTESESSVCKVMFGPTPTSKRIFNQVVTLGNELVFLDDAVIVNQDEILRKVASKDGEVVPVTFRPLCREARYVLNDAPQVGDLSWDESLLSCINLEKSLNERLAVRYNNLAASSTESLTSDEIIELTERPKLDLDAHLINEE